MHKKGRTLFCPTCGTSLELISPLGRCASCFEESPLDTCFPCLEKGEGFLRHRAYCIELEGPWELFLYEAPLSTQAALLVYQYLQLEWPWPGVVFSSETLFGREVAHFLGVPFRKRAPFYGEHVLVVERQERLDEAPYDFLLEKGAASMDLMILSVCSAPDEEQGERK